MLLIHRVINYCDAIMTLVAPVTITLILHYFAKDHVEPSLIEPQDDSKAYFNLKIESSMNCPSGSINEPIVGLD